MTLTSHLIFQPVSVISLRSDAPFFCASDTGGNVYQDDYRFVESLPGPSQFAEPHPDDAERFYSDLFEAGVTEGMRGFENVRRTCVRDLRANLSLTQTALLQDFMNYNLLAMPLFRQEHDASRRWLAGMNAAAIKHSKPSWAGSSLSESLLSNSDNHASRFAGADVHDAAFRPHGLD